MSDTSPPISKLHPVAARRDNLEMRSRIVQAVRRFFHHRGYLEVETPIRIPAPAPEAHIDPQPSGDWYLQTSPELCMKRLLAAGFPRIFQICKCFRHKERGARHLPEMTLLEWYCKGIDYGEMMHQCEDLIRFISTGLGRGDDLVYRGRRISLQQPWRRLTVKEAFSQLAPMPMDRALRDNRFDEILALDIEPQLGTDRPVFLYDYPVEKAALARPKPGTAHLAERFELYIAGVELCNAFSELIDPVEQRRRFEAERAWRRANDKPVGPLPETFLQSLADMPPAAGNALGLDRLVMLFTDAAEIDAVVAFTPEEL